MNENKIQLTENQWIEKSHADWVELLSKELKTNDLESKVIHIDYDVIYDPFAERISYDDNIQVLDFKPLSVGLDMGGVSADDGNRILRDLLKYDLRVIRISGDDNTDWKRLFDGIFLDMITVIIEFQSQSASESFGSYKSESEGSDRWKILSNIAKGSETRLLDYSEYGYLKNSELLRCILFDLDKENHSNIHLSLNLSENLLHSIPFIRALRILLQQRHADKSITISGKRSLKASNVEDSNQQVIEATSTAMFSAMSGVDVLFFDPISNMDATNEHRILLNIQNLMSLESGMDNVSDPLQGSYIIENLTRQYLDII